MPREPVWPPRKDRGPRPVLLTASYIIERGGGGGGGEVCVILL